MTLKDNSNDVFEIEIGTFDWIRSIYVIFACIIKLCLIYLPQFKLCDSQKYQASQLNTYYQILEKRGDNPNFVAVGKV